MTLEELYRHLRWPMHPGDPEAVERYEAIMSFFLERLGSEIPLTGDARILDIAAGTGIASIALAEALTRRGATVREITVTDARGEDLDAASTWARDRGLTSIRLHTLQVDGRRLAEELDGGYNYILLWGSTLPHFSTWDYALIVANTRELLRGDGVFMVEQKDLLPQILHTNTYKDIHTAPGKGPGAMIVSIMSGYDKLSGTEIRQQYLLPGFHYLGETRTRLWDTATILTITWLFYKEVTLLETSTPTIKDVIIARKPREDAPPAQSLAATLPTSIQRP